MGYIVQEPHITGARYIDPREAGHMIARTHWTMLDDCHFGIPANNVDWDNCPPSLKSNLILEYNMGYIVNGYQPKKHKEQSEKEYWYDKIDRNVDVGMHSLGWLGYPPMLYLFLWPVLMAKGLPIGGAIFISLVCIIPWVIFSVIVGSALALLTGIIAYGIHYPILRRREKTEAEQKEFDKFIKGCRK